MATSIDELDEVRHQHHLRERSEVDKRVAYYFWLAIVGTLLARLGQRTLSSWKRRRRIRSQSNAPRNSFELMHRTAAIVQALSLLSLPALPRIAGLHLPSLGRSFLICEYVLLICILVVSVDAPRFSSHFLDDVAFRAAWVTLAQVPLAYFSATKRGPLNIIGALSYERVNWVHKWVGRTLFLSATTHMSIMMYSISVYDIFQSPDKVMIIVRYGVGAYGTLLWIALTSAFPLRRWSYRLFYANHLISTCALLFVLFKHVPKYARSPIYLAAGFILIDKMFSIYHFIHNNITLRSSGKDRSSTRDTQGSLKVGYSVKLTTPPPAVQSHFSLDNVYPPQRGTATVVRICDVPFSWRPGQHVRLYVPRLGLLEVHPFTPATCPSIPVARGSELNQDSDVEQDWLLHQPRNQQESDMVLMIRAQGGLTLRLAQYYSRWLSSPCPNTTKPPSALRAYVDGPYGEAPQWEDYENLILIATSTGVSFTLSILDFLAKVCWQDPKRLRVRRLSFIWISRHVDAELDTIVTEMATANLSFLREAGMTVTFRFFTTCPDSGKTGEARIPGFDPFAHLRQPCRRLAGRPLLKLGLQGDVETQNQTNLEHDAVMESRESPEDDECSTLVDGDEEELSLTELGEPLIRSHEQPRPSTPAPPRRNTSTNPPTTHSCSCRLIQSRVGSKDYPRSSQHLARTFGSRPDIRSILSAASPEGDTSRTMVGVCVNAELMIRTKNDVARMNLAYAAGKRRTGLDIFTEGFT